MASQLAAISLQLLQSQHKLRAPCFRPFRDRVTPPPYLQLSAIRTLRPNSLAAISHIGRPSYTASKTIMAEIASILYIYTVSMLFLSQSFEQHYSPSRIVQRAFKPRLSMWVVTYIIGEARKAEVQEVCWCPKLFGLVPRKG
ncbi:hypothetical protein EMIT0111MI5_170049 [Burkholderia sp. IT-111MI5]